MVNPHDLKVLELFAPWNEEGPTVSDLPAAENLSVDLLTSLNRYAVSEDFWDLRLWTLHSGASINDDSYVKIFTQAWDRASRFGYDRESSNFLNECGRADLPFEAATAYIEFAKPSIRHFHLNSVMIARVWFALSVERRKDLAGSVALDQEIATWILDNAVTEVNPVKLVPYVRGPYELNELVELIEVSTVNEASQVVRSKHFEFNTVFKVMKNLLPREAVITLRVISEEHPEIAQTIRETIEKPSPLLEDAPAELALEAKRVGRRRNISLEDIIEAEVPYRIFAKPYDALKTKVMKQGDLNEIEKAVLVATDEHLRGLEILRKFGDNS